MGKEIELEISNLQSQIDALRQALEIIAAASLVDRGSDARIVGREAIEQLENIVEHAASPEEAKELKHLLQGILHHAESFWGAVAERAEHARKRSD